MTISIIGDNQIGQWLRGRFKDVVTYEPDDISGKNDFCFVCASLPIARDGTLEIVALENLFEKINSSIIVLCIKVLPGTTDYLKKKYNKRIVFLSMIEKSQNAEQSFFICGGTIEDIDMVLELFRQHRRREKIYHTTAKTAELNKYIENLWLAMQVTFANEFYNICEKIGVDYHKLCDLWTLDSKISEHCTSIDFNMRGFSEQDQTNDLAAMISWTQQIELESYFFEGISRSNSFNLRRNQKNHPENSSREKDIIRFYQIDHPYGFFSNFSHHPIYLKNKIWMTSEHYYQAQKFAGTEDEETIRLTHSPVKAARTAHAKKNLVRPDWEVVKNDVMRKGLYAKFTQHPELTAELLATSPLTLVEHTTNDNY